MTSKLKSPDQIDPFSTGHKSLRVVIETPKGSPNKFKFDAEIAGPTITLAAGV